jgi:hypothetical protein
LHFRGFAGSGVSLARGFIEILSRQLRKKALIFLTGFLYLFRLLGASFWWFYYFAYSGVGSRFLSHPRLD